MPESTSEALRAALSDMQTKDPDIVEAAVITLDGLVIEGLRQADVGPDHVGAMSAALTAVAKRSAMELERGKLEQVLIKASQGYVVLQAAGEDAILTVLTRQNTNLGLVLMVVTRAAERIAAALAS